MLKILIAVDGSEHSRRAVETVARMAKFTPGLDAALLNVRNGPIYYGELPAFDYESVDLALRQQQEKLLADLLAHARACGLERATVHSAVGDVAREITRVASEQGVDQIAMGTRGMGAIGSLFMGSQAQRVIHLSDIPVLLVK